MTLQHSTATLVFPYNALAHSPNSMQACWAVVSPRNSLMRESKLHLFQYKQGLSLSPSVPRAAFAVESNKEQR